MLSNAPELGSETDNYLFEYEDLDRSSDPYAPNPGKSAGPVLPKPTFSPVPPVLSGPDQAVFSQWVEGLWAGPIPKARIIRHVHAITRESLITLIVAYFC
jgi:hypothetical protein